MKIVLVIDQFDDSNNGTTVTARRFAGQLRRRGHEVVILAGGAPCEGKICAPVHRIPVFQKLIESQGMCFAKPDEEAYYTAFKDADIVHFYMPFRFCRRGEELARQIRKLMGEMINWKEKDLPSVLVVGLGNRSVTPDSLGPRVLGNLQVTRHLDGQYGETFLKDRKLPAISGIAPGVMAQTGMETAEILKGIISETHPDLIIAIDALAARSVRRLGTTIQLTDTGIHPGSGVGNHRHSLTRESLGVPVLAIGVPTVVGAAAIVHDTVSALIRVLADNDKTKGTGSWIEDMDSDQQYQLIRELLEPEFGPLYVTPPDIDQSVKQLSFTISEGIHQAVFP